MIQAVLTNSQHPECGVVTVRLPSYSGNAVVCCVTENNE